MVKCWACSRKDLNSIPGELPLCVAAPHISPSSKQDQASLQAIDTDQLPLLHVEPKENNYKTRKLSQLITYHIGGIH